LSVLLPLWESIPTLRRCYIRLLSPEGDVHDVWQNDLEATLEGLDTPHQIFRSQKQWELFLNSQRAIATEWDLRNTLTDADRCFLDSLKISWEPLNMRARRYQLYGQIHPFTERSGVALGLVWSSCLAFVGSFF
jgi:hypothetical protein